MARPERWRSNLSAAHMAAVIATLVVIVFVIGSVCATEGALRHGHAARWGLVGAASALAGVLAGGWLLVVLVVAPLVAVLEFRTAPRTHNRHIHELTDVGPRRSNLMIAKLGLVLAAVLLPYAAASGLLQSAQRTSIAQPTIVDSDLVTAYGPVGARGEVKGHLVAVVTYTFTASGQLHKSKAQRQWSKDQFTSAKVCYDPNDVDGSHALELAGYQCGSFDLHPND